MKKNIILLLMLAFIFISCSPDTTRPKVISTIPVNGDKFVDPSLTELSVTFSEPMMDGNWSWAYETLETFPTMTGDPRYENKNRTNILPVKLEPNKYYEAWINSAKFKNFKDKAGNPSVPFKLLFKTKGK
jgi:hypothetical protein